MIPERLVLAASLLARLVGAKRLQAPYQGQDQAAFAFGTVSQTNPWTFADGPRANLTSHLIFDTVSSLLQHWPNTRYRNGTFHKFDISVYLT